MNGLSKAMRCSEHDLATGPDGTCVLCRRESSSHTKGTADAGSTEALPPTDHSTKSAKNGAPGDPYTKARARLEWGHAEETVVEDLVRAGIALEDARAFVQEDLQKEDEATRWGGVSGLVVSIAIGAVGAAITAYFLPFIPVGSGDFMALLESAGVPICDWEVAPKLLIWMGPVLMGIGLVAASQSLASMIFGGRRSQSA